MLSLVLIGSDFFSAGSPYSPVYRNVISALVLGVVFLMTMFVGYKIYRYVKAKEYDRAWLWGVVYLALPWVLLMGACITLGIYAVGLQMVQ